MATNNNYKEKIAMKFNVSQLNRIIVALVNNGFNKKFASNVSRLFSLFDQNYKNEYDKEVRTYLINELTTIILTNKIDSREGILSFLDTDGKYYNDTIDILNNLCKEDIPENELALLDRTISNQLKYSSIMEKSDKLSDMLVNLKSENYDDLGTAITEIEGEIDNVNKEIKSARESIEDSKKDMSLSSSNFVNILGEYIEEDKNPASKIKTGIQYLNTMFNGGLERGRLYCALGVAKGWKSGFLLNSAIWAKKYNTLMTHDPKLKPVIVYLSMENTNKETISRSWAYAFGNNSNMSSYDKVTAARMLEKAGIFTPNNPNSPELRIWFRANRSINTSELNIMLEDLKKEGCECCFLVLDYLKRIKPTETNKDLRLELSNITNELKTIAMTQDIPILTAMQLNREAFKTLEDANSFDEKVRASDKLNASQVGESIDIVQNVDYAFIVNKMDKRQINEDGELEFSDRYLFLKLIACRSKQPSIISIKHRFVDDNDMRLIEDINMPRPISTNTEIDFIKDRISHQEAKKPIGGKRTVVF